MLLFGGGALINAVRFLPTGALIWGGALNRILRVAVLRNLSEHCESGATLEDRLCERFVRGINDECIQRRLLSETDLKLTKAVDIAVAITQSTEGARDLDTKSINVVKKTSVQY